MRRGFSLAELMVALVIAGIIGIALTRLVVNQARFMGDQQGRMMARASARAGFNAVVNELRNVTLGGVLQAHADSVTVRVPFAAGITCTQPSGGTQAILLEPYDSATFAAATIRGYAWRDGAGTWHFEEPATFGSGAATGDCTSLTPTIPFGISPATTITASAAPPLGAFRVVRVSPNDPTATAGEPVYLYQRIRYALAPSAELPGRTALWRSNLDAGTRDELVAPFDTGSSFSFLVNNAMTAQTAVPAVLDSIRGFRLRLVGQSEDNPEGETAPSHFTLTTDIVFINRAP